jgi:transposase
MKVTGSIYILKVLTFSIHFSILYSWKLKKQQIRLKHAHNGSAMELGKASCRFCVATQTSMSGTPEGCRRFLSAIVWLTKEGATWRGLPKVYGYWNTIYRRFSRWCDVGVFQALHEHFHEAGELSALLVDSTMVRAHSSAAGAPKKKAGNKQKLSDAAEVALPQN